MKSQPEHKQIQCAIYTRKSTIEGAEQEFTSLDAQRESAESYIASQKSQGWIALPTQYDDHGFTGANLERPALQSLIADIEQGKIDCVVVYKVDRLSRSLLDFTRLLEFFEQKNVTFVSVTQHFNTNTSMGRLTLNILLSFAQFEREIISERTRDKMAAARKRGKWVGGRPALGYDLDTKNHCLVVNKKEADIIRKIFEFYLKEKSLLSTAMRLNEMGYRTKTYIQKGKPTGGVKFKNTNIQHIIKNMLYLGKIHYRGAVYEGVHEPIVSEAVFQQAQEILAINRRKRSSTKNTPSIGLLSRLLRCTACDAAMSHTYTAKNKYKYRYYVCVSALKRGRKNCPAKSINAEAVENAVVNELHDLPAKQKWNAMTLQEQTTIIKSILSSVEYDGRNGTLKLWLHNVKKPQECQLHLKSEKRVREENLSNEPLLRKQLLLAHQIQRLLENGKAKDVKQIAGWLNMRHSRVNQILNLLFLSPRIQEEVLCAKDAGIAKISERTLRKIATEVVWSKQQEAWEILKR